MIFSRKPVPTFGIMLWLGAARFKFRATRAVPRWHALPFTAHP
jgi:hypothetical protein